MSRDRWRKVFRFSRTCLFVIGLAWALYLLSMLVALLLIEDDSWQIFAGMWGFFILLLTAPIGLAALLALTLAWLRRRSG